LSLFFLSVLCFFFILVFPLFLSYLVQADSWWLPAHLGGGAPTLAQAREMDEIDAAGRRARKATKEQG